MAHSVELTLDADTDAAVRAIWERLREAGLPSQATHTGASNRPHVTVTVGAALSGAVDRALAERAAGLELSCRIGAPLVFGRGRSTLALLVVPSAELLELHRQLHRICLPHMPSGPFEHTRPGQWTPHVTLARRVRSEQLAGAIDIAADGPELAGRFIGLRRWDGDARIEYPLTG